MICIAEDRATETVAIKLLLLSLGRHCPDLPVVLFFPPANEEFLRWSERFPGLEVVTEPVPGAYTWNNKPQVMLPLLDGRVEEVWWIDSDVILSGDFRTRIPALDHQTLVVCEEALNGKPEDGGRRARAWGFELGRVLPGAVNPCVMRATGSHKALFERWQNLESPEYLAAQDQLWFNRPGHMLSDMDVLTALLSSVDYAGVSARMASAGEGDHPILRAAGLHVERPVPEPACGSAGVRARAGKPEAVEARNPRRRVQAALDR